MTIENIESWTKDMIVEALRFNPDAWANLFINQNETINELNELLVESNTRLELLLRDPDDRTH